MKKHHLLVSRFAVLFVMMSGMVFAAPSEACSFYWHNGLRGQYKPERPDRWTWGEELPGKGTLYCGTKNDGYTDERSNHPRLADKERINE